MIDSPLDVDARHIIAGLGEKALSGSALTPDEVDSLLRLETSVDIFDLMSWANRVREKHHGDKIRLCSIVNVKAGGCAEDCKFCAQSSLYSTDSPRYGFIDSEPVLQAAGSQPAKEAEEEPDIDCMA